MASGVTALADVAPADEQYFYHLDSSRVIQVFVKGANEVQNGIFVT